jgi:hypothetical protein
MKCALAILAALFLACSALTAEDTVEPFDPAALMLPVRSIVGAFNAHDAKLPEYAVTEDAVILDRYPPFVWSGTGAANVWYESLMGRTAREQAMRRKLEEHIEIGKPQSVSVVSDRAYLVVPFTLTWLRQGKAARHTGLWAVTERRREGGAWRISGQSWAMNSEHGS